MQTIELLPCQLDASILEHPDFFPACSGGFDTCEEWFGDLPSTFDEMRDFVLFDVRRRYDCQELVYGVPSLPFRVGFCLGFLSAFVHSSRDLALFGVACLSRQVPLQYQEEVERGFDPLSGVPGQRC